MLCSFVLWLTTILSLHIWYANAHQCLEKCECVWSGGKLNAYCVGLGLTKLPEISDKKSAGDIQIINLTRNNLVELKRNIFFNANLINLQKISLHKVGLEKIDENAFYRLKNIIDLDLSSNTLTHIPSESLRSLVLLRVLDLSSNQISSVPKHAFINSTNLKTLLLSRNRINLIDDNAFVGLSNLEYLKLDGNHLTNIESTSLQPLIKLHSLTLSDNKWKCDCHMRQFRKYILTNARISVNDEPKCFNSAKIWTHLGLDSFMCSPVILMDSKPLIKMVTEGNSLLLDCAVYLGSEESSAMISIDWYWNSVHILNNSKGCGSDCHIDVTNGQYFLITESIETNKSMFGFSRKYKVSNLKLSSVLLLNSGSYYCKAHNNAGTAHKNFTIIINGVNSVGGKVVAAAAASESGLVNYTNNSIPRDDGTDKIVIGLILGILFGIFFVLMLFSVSVVLLCRRRRYNQNNTDECNEEDDTELEKLTENSTNVIINPIKKPPRLTRENSNDYATLQVWLPNGDQNMREYSDGSIDLLRNDNYIYDDVMMLSNTVSSNEPDLIHPSVYDHNRHNIQDLDGMTIISDATEV